MSLTVKDLQIGSPVYCVLLDSIKVARVRMIEAFTDGTRKIELNHQEQYCVAKEDAVEISTEGRRSGYSGHWHLNIEDARLFQLTIRNRRIEALKKAMIDAQNEFADAVQRYAFAEPSAAEDYGEDKL